MDLHPIIVHFPVALLTLYCVFELARFPVVTRHAAWFYVKAALLIAGALALPLALVTGDEAADAFESGSMHDIVEAHERFAQAASLVFAALAACYLVSFLERESSAFARSRIGNALASPALLAQKWWVAVPLAAIGFLLLLVTGALGGVLVYGPEADPIAPYILALLGL